MKLLVSVFFILCTMVSGCGGSAGLSSRYSYEDKAVFDLVDRLNKNAGDREAARLLPQAYDSAVEKRRDVAASMLNTGRPGDRYMEVAKEWQVIQRMYDQVKGSVPASRALPAPWNPGPEIERARQKAAEEYYDMAAVYMGYNTRDYAQMAYDNFLKASRAVPGFRDVDSRIRDAADRATLRVLVNPVNYYSYNWSHWGFQNDFLQQQMVRDLNARAWANVRFYSDWELRSQQLVPDRIVDLNFTDLFIDQVHSDSRSYRRSAEIETGQTKTNPPRPVYTTVYATVFVNRRYMSSYATLECRIYDRESNRDILYDRFPDRFDWRQETARYTGDRRALTAADWALINNRYDDYPPSRNQIADRLVRNCYQQLLSRIQSYTSF